MFRRGVYANLATILTTSLFAFGSSASKDYSIDDLINKFNEGECIEKLPDAPETKYCRRTLWFPKINGIRYFKAAVGYTETNGDLRTFVGGARLNLRALELTLDGAYDGGNNVRPDGIPDHSIYKIISGDDLKALEDGGAEGALKTLALTHSSELETLREGHDRLYHGLIGKAFQR